MSNDDIECFICFDGSGHLLSPCPCRGATGYVHLDCLLESFKGRGEWFDLRCPQCKHDYWGQAAVDIASIAFTRSRRRSDPTTATQR